MSHFSVLVLTKDGSDEEIEQLLAKYDENHPTDGVQPKWDWWQIGGRWTGSLTDYDPSMDPKNWERCNLCYGTGTRTVPVPDPTWKPEEGKCNGCEQYRNRLPTGMRVKFQFEPYDGDTAPLDSIAAAIDPFIPFALVTPEGEWIERGQMGWWAVVKDEKDEKKWGEQVKKIYKKYEGQGIVAVVVDCHI